MTQQISREQSGTGDVSATAAVTCWTLWRLKGLGPENGCRWWKCQWLCFSSWDGWNMLEPMPMVSIWETWVPWVLHSWTLDESWDHIKQTWQFPLLVDSPSSNQLRCGRLLHCGILVHTCFCWRSSEDSQRRCHSSWTGGCVVVAPAPLTNVIFETYSILQLSSGAETTTHLWMSSIPDMGSEMLWVSSSSHLLSAAIAAALLHSPYKPSSSAAHRPQGAILLWLWSLSNGNNYLGSPYHLDHLIGENGTNLKPRTSCKRLAIQVPHELLAFCSATTCSPNKRTNTQWARCDIFDRSGWLTKPGSNMFQPCSWYLNRLKSFWELLGDSSILF